jgi:hypothetical protein
MVTTFAVPSAGSNSEGFLTTDVYPTWAQARGAAAAKSFFQTESPSAVVVNGVPGFYIQRGCLNFITSAIPAAAVPSNPRLHIKEIAPKNNPDNTSIVVAAGQFSDHIALGDWPGMVAGGPAIFAVFALSGVPAPPNYFDIPLSITFLTYLNRLGNTKLGLFIALDYPANLQPAGLEDGFTAGQLALLVDYPTLPFADAAPATSIGAFSANFNGQLFDLGDSPFVDVAFEYGIVSGVYPFTTPSMRLTTPNTYTTLVSGLTPDTTYFYRTIYFDNNHRAPIVGFTEESFKTTPIPVFLNTSHPLSRT